MGSRWILTLEANRGSMQDSRVISQLQPFGISFCLPSLLRTPQSYYYSDHTEPALG